ncbi:MAG: type II toxin-antitoxin system RelE/ParE family toxin [Polaromonas sp.]|jgi:toxin ParE1/3/4|nr:type II toxin-antitoxin system RelE/ParE family toxin [Polaromonas sp.]
MSSWLEVGRSARYLSDLQAVHDYIEQDNPDAAMELLLRIEDQVDSLSDPNFPRRRGRKAGTLELVAHPNYVVVLEQTATTVTALTVMHVARQYP